MRTIFSVRLEAVGYSDVRKSGPLYLAVDKDNKTHIRGSEGLDIERPKNTVLCIAITEGRPEL